MAVITSKVVEVAEWVKLLDNFADNEWSAIIWACQTGNVPETWTVGSQKPMTINGTNYAIDIIGLYHDDYADGGKAPITFQMHDLYATKYGMNATSTNVGGWKDCVMRNTHLPAIMALMPEEVQAAIKSVNKLTSVGNGSTTIETTEDKLFLLAEIEVWGVTQFSASGEGSRYAYYANGGSIAKTLSGTQTIWYNRSPRVSNTANFCRPSADGSGRSSSAAMSAYGVAFAFCF